MYAGGAATGNIYDPTFTLCEQMTDLLHSVIQSEGHS